MFEVKILATADFVGAINNLAEAIKSISGGTITKNTLSEISNAQSIPVAPVQTVAPVQQAPTAAPVTDTHIQSATVPTAAPAYTLDMLSRAGAALVDAGKMPQLIELLQRYGVNAITEVRPENYGAIALELKALGAQL